MTKELNIETDGYRIEVHAKNFPLTDAIRSYVHEKLTKVERFSKAILDISVNLDIQKLEHSATILMKFMHFQIRSHASTEDTYSAIDKAVDRLVRLVHKYKDRLEDHQVKALGAIDLNVNVLQPQRDELSQINQQIEEENIEDELKKYALHDVVAKETMKVRMLTQDEAVMEMELSGRDFMIYQSEEDQKIKALYRRDDGNFGLIEVEKK